MYMALYCGLLVLIAQLIIADIPVLHLYNGHVPIEHPPSSTQIEQLVVGQPYTFEIYMENVLEQDYMVQSCLMNGKVFINDYGCVLCGDGILTSIETEQYARAGAVKRTLVHFIAQQQTVNLVCNIRVFECSGCAERSCERHPVLTMLPVVTHSLVYPIVVVKGPYIPLWLIILLLILLLLCCLALCLIPFFLLRRRRKQSKTEIDVKQRGIGVETDRAELKETAVGCRNVHHYSVDNVGIHHIKPAVAMGECESIMRSEEMRARDQRFYRDQMDTYDSGASYNLTSYRNFAYDRDIGRVAPMEGYDEIQTRERRLYGGGGSEEDFNVEEKDVERIHTSRFVQKSQRIVEDDVSSTGERYREEDVHHAVYS